MSYQRITLEEREEIFRLWYIERLTMSGIGIKLGKDKSSVSRELQRGTKNKMYNPLTGVAHRRNARKSQCPRLKTTDEIWGIVKPKLEKRWSQEEIEKRLKDEYPEYSMSAKMIYNYIHFHMKGELKKAA